MKNNKGISLVELVVTLAILSVVSAGVAGLIAVSMRTYGRVSTDAQAQNEAQLAVNQLEGLIIDCTNGISFVENKDDNEDLRKHNSTVYTNMLYVYNAKERYVVGWDGDHQQLWYYREQRNPSAPEGFTLVSESSRELLAEYVSDFFVDVTSTESDRKVKLGMKFDVAERHYESNRSVTMRNRTIVNGNLDDMYVDGVEVNTTYDGISITIDGERFIENGKVKYFKTWEPNDADTVNNELYVATLGVSVIGDGYPSQDVTWIISDPDAAEIVGGRLHVKKTSEFTITTKAKGAPEDLPASLTVTILTHQITGIEPTSPANGTKLVKGESYQPKAEVKGANVSGYDTYTWEILSGGTKTGKKFVVDDTDSKVKIKFTSEFDSSVNAVIEYEKQDVGGSTEEIDNTVYVELGAGLSTAARGDRIQYHLYKIQGLLRQEITRRTDVKWSCELLGSAKGTVGISRVGVLSIGKNILPKNEDAEVRVSAVYTDDNGKKYTVETKITVLKAGSNTGSGDDDEEGGGNKPDPWDPVEGTGSGSTGGGGGGGGNGGGGGGNTDYVVGFKDDNVELKLNQSAGNYRQFQIKVTNNTNSGHRQYKVIFTFSREVLFDDLWNNESTSVPKQTMTNRLEVVSTVWDWGSYIQPNSTDERMGISFKSDEPYEIENVEVIWMY